MPNLKQATQMFRATMEAPAPVAAAGPGHIMAAEICARIELPQPARALLRSDMTGKQYVEALLEKKYRVPAIDFLANALAPREAVWWGCLCMQHACGDHRMAEAERNAARATVVWVIQPTEESRSAAAAAMGGAGSSVAARLAQAVGQAPTLNALPGGEWAGTVAGAVKLASVAKGPLKSPALQTQFVQIGLTVARGALG